MATVAYTVKVISRQIRSRTVRPAPYGRMHGTVRRRTRYVKERCLICNYSDCASVYSYLSSVRDVLNINLSIFRNEAASHIDLQCERKRPVGTDRIPCPFCLSVGPSVGNDRVFWKKRLSCRLKWWVVWA